MLYGSIEATLDRSQGRNVWITMGLREGKNREIKNVLGALGLEVNRLIRISYGPFQLGDLPEGEALEVRGRTLRDQLGPRLIQEAKANFEAPLYNEGAAGEEAAEKPARGERNDRSDARERAPARGEGRPEGRRDDRGSFGSKPRGKSDFKGDFKRDDRDFGDEKPKKRPPMGTSRTANVWMAPGARPTADGKERKSSARAEAEQLFKKPVESDRRVVVNRTSDEDGDWIRADEAPVGRSRDDDRGDFGGRRSFGDRPPRGDRPFSDKPRGDRPYGDRRPREMATVPRVANAPSVTSRVANVRSPIVPVASVSPGKVAQSVRPVIVRSAASPPASRVVARPARASAASRAAARASVVVAVPVAASLVAARAAAGPVASLPVANPARREVKRSCASSVVNSAAARWPLPSRTRSGRPSTGRARACSISSVTSMPTRSMAAG